MSFCRSTFISNIHFDNSVAINMGSNIFKERVFKIYIQIKENTGVK